MDLAFTLALHRAVDPDPDNDLCWSPFSVLSALGLTAAGAEGASRDELVGALLGESPAVVGGSGALAGGLAGVIPGDGQAGAGLASAGTGDRADEGRAGWDGRLTAQAALLAAASELADTGHGEAPVLAVSNTLWAAEELPIRREFANELARWPSGAVKGAPFGDAPEDARKLINTDVAETTRGLIPELIPPGSIRPTTVAALVNALYLKVAWQHRFADSGTTPRPFHAPTGTYKPATMRQTERLGYAHRDGWQIVTLPAAGAVDAMVLLPDEPLTVAEPALDAGKLRELLGTTSSQRVQLTMPKINVSTRASFKHPLLDLGVRTPFVAGQAGLTRLCPDPRLYVDDVLHESVLKFDEQGLEGAAATAVTMRMMSMAVPSDPVVVDVDRPFLVVVLHRETGVPYFVARVVHP
ncbi:serpin family protein [Kutzneria sp. CA-103260]|uniref:serpin family protein n=1 Tax=Kutzneria sp. CA-103260 TaxID=2802641 RepID=UPI001BACC1FC|nr:serpin family protein [Kutzneria sp. CA-103260]QUQ67969.1 serine protease inhibitor serpin-like protein [Kutzneria sp. CA-103260]